MMKKYRNLLLLLFLFLFGGYYISSSFFYHTHTINGVRLMHSHPYGNDHEGHGHSSEELVFFLVHALTMTWLLAEALALVFLHSGRQLPLSELIQIRLFSCTIAALPPRGPPA